MLFKKSLHFPIILFALVIHSAAFSQRPVKFSLNDFEEVSIPKYGSPEWYKLNNAVKNEIAVSVVSGQIAFSVWEEPPFIEYPLSGGTLVGIDLGEFGGGLFFSPQDTTKNSVHVNGRKIGVDRNLKRGMMIMGRNRVEKLQDVSLLIKFCNPVFIFPFNGDLYLLEGLAHGISYGNIFKIKVQTDSFTINRVLELEDAPMAIEVQPERILVVTYSQFYIVDNQMNKSRVFDLLFWDGLHPNSIASLDEHNIYIGMRGGFAKMDLSKKEVKFYKLKD